MYFGPASRILLFLFLAAPLFADAPEKVDGYIFYENATNVGAGSGRSSSSSAFLLRNDGTFSGLFAVSFSSGVPYFLSDANDGTYSYRRLDSFTATLDLGFKGPDGTSKRTLNFTSDISGTIVADPIHGIAAASFRLAPLSRRAPLVNCSNRSFVPPGGTAFTGFVVADGDARTVLIRAVGPGLTPFGVTDSLRDPKITLRRASATVEATTNDDWPSGSPQSMRRTGAIVGAFALPENSKDAGMIVRLAPGNYVAEVHSSDPADSGQILLEVYLLP